MSTSPIPVKAKPFSQSASVELTADLTDALKFMTQRVEEVATLRSFDSVLELCTASRILWMEYFSCVSLDSKVEIVLRSEMENIFDAAISQIESVIPPSDSVANERLEMYKRSLFFRRELLATLFREGKNEVVRRVELRNREFLTVGIPAYF